MGKFVKHRSKKSGLPPGTLIHIGEKRRETTAVTVFRYNEHEYEEKTIEKLEEYPIFEKQHAVLSKENSVTWLNIDGVHDIEAMKRIGDYFKLHPLVQEDITNTAQRPKIEDYGDYLYIVAKMLYQDSETDEMVSEQVSIILGDHYVLSFQEGDPKRKDVFSPVRDSIKNGMGRIRRLGADYLAYILLDAIVDNYFVILEKLGDKIDNTEEELVMKPMPKTLKAIHYLKREALFLHKSIWPLREVMSSLQRRESLLIQESTEIYLRDVYDHVIQVMDTTETIRDMLSGMLDIYLSSVSNRMNEVMKVLTIISTVFIPLTFIAGVYGMNFKYMPELEWPWAYPAVWILMLVIAYFMLRYFKRKKWL